MDGNFIPTRQQYDSEIIHYNCISNTNADSTLVTSRDTIQKHYLHLTKVRMMKIIEDKIHSNQINNRTKPFRVLLNMKYAHIVTVESQIILCQ